MGSHQQRLFDPSEETLKPIVLIANDGSVTYDAYYLDPWKADALFDALLRDTPWRQEYLRMYGRSIALPRLTAWYGDPGASYTYSGIENAPLEWTQPLGAVRDMIERSHGVRFNSVLLNLYRNGRDSLSWHADDEVELGESPAIASVSLGAARLLQLQHRVTGEVISVNLEHGSLLMMTGAVQRCWKHQVPKERDVSEPRINLTFRYMHAATANNREALRSTAPRRARGKGPVRG